LDEIGFIPKEFGWIFDPMHCVSERFWTKFVGEISFSFDFHDSHCESQEAKANAPIDRRFESRPNSTGISLLFH
jgi:hypothetical protein